MYASDSYHIHFHGCNFTEMENKVIFIHRFITTFSSLFNGSVQIPHDQAEEYTISSQIFFLQLRLNLEDDLLRLSVRYDHLHLFLFHPKTKNQIISYSTTFSE